MWRKWAMYVTNIYVWINFKQSGKIIDITKISKVKIDMINNKARYNRIDAKYRQMAFRSVPTNPYLESLVKQNWCKFRGLCLHSTSVVILPNRGGRLLKKRSIEWQIKTERVNYQRCTPLHWLSAAAAVWNFGANWISEISTRLSLSQFSSAAAQLS